MRLVTGVLALAVTVLVANNAEARRYHQPHRHHATTAKHHSSHHKSRFHARRAHGARTVHRARHGARIAARGRPRAWCGWWLGNHLGIADRGLWLARNWAKVGRNAGGPRVGAVVVWRHHVGIITGRVGNQWIVKSGNDGSRVRERPRSIAGAIAFRAV